MSGKETEERKEKLDSQEALHAHVRTRVVCLCNSAFDALTAARVVFFLAVLGFSSS